jgi:hypothetical protein
VSFYHAMRHMYLLEIIQKCNSGTWNETKRNNRVWKMKWNGITRKKRKFFRNNNQKRNETKKNNFFQTLVQISNKSHGHTQNNTVGTLIFVDKNNADTYTHSQSMQKNIFRETCPGFDKIKEQSHDHRNDKNKKLTKKRNLPVLNNKNVWRHLEFGRYFDISWLATLILFFFTLIDFKSKKLDINNLEKNLSISKNS